MGRAGAATCPNQDARLQSIFYQYALLLCSCAKGGSGLIASPAVQFLGVQPGLLTARSAACGASICSDNIGGSVDFASVPFTDTHASLDHAHKSPAGITRWGGGGRRGELQLCHGLGVRVQQHGVGVAACVDS